MDLLGSEIKESIKSINIQEKSHELLQMASLMYFIAVYHTKYQHILSIHLELSQTVD